jgi:hypothetical protein
VLLLNEQRDEGSTDSARCTCQKNSHARYFCTDVSCSTLGKGLRSRFPGKERGRFSVKRRI